MAEHHTLCILLSVGTLVFELFYFVSLFLPPNSPPCSSSAASCSTFRLLSDEAGHPFFEHILLNAILLLFLDREWFTNQVNRLTSLRTAHAPARQAA